ncbi:MAG: TIGR02186 family protein [Nitratireductor sp.]
MRNTALVLSFLGVTLTCGTAQADQLVTDLSEHQISIRSNFTGTEILIFGAVEAEDPTDLATERDIVVVVTGPEGPEQAATETLTHLMTTSVAPLVR